MKQIIILIRDIPKEDEEYIKRMGYGDRQGQFYSILDDLRDIGYNSGIHIIKEKDGTDIHRAFINIADPRAIMGLLQIKHPDSSTV